MYQRTSFDIIDCHHHFGDFSSSLGPMPGGAAERSTDVEDYRRLELATRLRAMDEQGVGQAIILPGHSYLRPNGVMDTQRVNDTVAEYRDLHPERFPGAVGVVEPVYGDAGFAELERMKDELGHVGVSFHVRFQGATLDSPWVRGLIRRSVELGLVPFIHVIAESSENALWKLEVIAEENPDASIVALDAFTSFEQTRHVPYIAERYPHLLFDTSLAYNFDAIASVIGSIGADRVVFGTDLYSMTRSGGHILGQILESDLDDAAKAKVLGENIRTALKLPLPTRGEVAAVPT